MRVWKNPELSVEAPVLPDGTLTVPLAGTVSARGLTAAELEDLLAGKLAEYITAPEVSVIVLQVNSKRVSVLGEVQRARPAEHRRQLARGRRALGRRAASRRSRTSARSR